MNIEWLKNKEQDRFYPVSNTKAILYGDTNKTLDQAIEEGTIGKGNTDECITDVTSSKGIITYTKGDKTTSEINTQDNFVTLTKDEYETLVNAGEIDEDTYYFVTDTLSYPTILQYVTLAASDWAESSDGTYYTQTVTANCLTESDTPMVIKNLPFSTSKTESAKYMKAFGILCSGLAETGDKSVTWKVFKKPTTDISVGLMKVLA